MRGGSRYGAGRKKGCPNLLTQELREKINAEDCINFLRDVVLGKELEATLSNRIDAATTLLRKILPDCKQTEIMTEPVRTIEEELRDIEEEDEKNF